MADLTVYGLANPPPIIRLTPQLCVAPSLVAFTAPLGASICIAHDIIELIGQTPLVHLSRIPQARACWAAIAVKLDIRPSASVKVGVEGGLAAAINRWFRKLFSLALCSDVYWGAARWGARF